MWNRLNKIVQAVGSLLSPDDEEMKQQGPLGGPDPSNPYVLHASGNTATDNAMPNTPAATPMLRRLASPVGGYSGDIPGRAKLPPSTDFGNGSVMPPADDPNSGFQKMPEFDPSIPRDGGRDMSSYEGEPGLTMPQERPRRRSEVDAEGIQEAMDMPKNTPKAKKRGFWNRLARGAGSAWHNWDEKGGLIGLVGDMLDQGLTEGIHPEQRAERVKQEGIGKMWKRYGQDVAVESQQDKAAHDRALTAKTQGDTLRAQNKPLYDSIVVDDIVTPDEAALATSAGYPMIPYDASQNDLQWVNGKPMSARKKGSPNYVRNPTLADRTEDVPRDTTISTANGDVTLPLKPGQAANTLVQAEVRAERVKADIQKRADEQTDKVYKSRKEFQSELRKWSTEDVGHEAKKKAAEAALETLDPEYDSAKIAEAKADIAAADFWIANRNKTKPKYIKPPVSTSTTSKGGKNNHVATEDEYQRELKRFKGSK